MKWNYNMFFCKPKPLVVKCYTFDAQAYEYIKPTLTNKPPTWLSSLCPITKVQEPDMPIGFMGERSTVAYCPGIKDFNKKSITLSSWYETEFLFDGRGNWRDATGPSFHESVVQHTADQIGGDFYKDRLFLKLVSPWKFVCDDGVDFLYNQNFYGSKFFADNDVIIPPGIVNFKHQASTNVHMWFKQKPEPHSVKIPIRTPLVSLFPITERDIKLEHHLISFDEYNKIGMMPKAPIGAYYKKLNFMRDN